VVGPIGLSWAAPGMSSIIRRELDGVRLTVLTNCRMGDGRAFTRNPRSEEMLAKLADDLHNADKNL